MARIFAIYTYIYIGIFWAIRHAENVLNVSRVSKYLLNVIFLLIQCIKHAQPAQRSYAIQIRLCRTRLCSPNAAAFSSIPNPTPIIPGECMAE